MKALFQSLQRVALFVSMLACRCANAGSSRPERQPNLSHPPTAITLLIQPARSAA